MSEITYADKKIYRKKIVDTAMSLINTPYEYGAEFKSLAIKPASVDCSEFVEFVYKFCGLNIPDGSQNQFNYCLHTDAPTYGDLAFFGRGKNPDKIYHVGILLDDGVNIIEARAYDPNAAFPTGRVILRPKERWENWKGWAGYRAHPQLV